MVTTDERAISYQLVMGANLMIMNVLLTALIGLGLAYTGARLDGPLGIAGAVRWLLQRPWWPGWVRNGADCVFCWSLSGSLVGAWLVVEAGRWPPTVGLELVIAWLAGFGLACFFFLYTGH